MHGHHHGHEGHAGSADVGGSRTFGVAMLVNLLYTAVEAGFGFHVNSLALLSDALHNLGDSLGLALAWGATVLARRSPTPHFTYGWRRATQLAPLANSLLLVGSAGALLGEALRRMAEQPEVPGTTVMVVAGIGIAVNLGTAALFHRGHAHDLNRRGAYLHLLADAAVSFAAVLAGLGMLLMGWRWLDPALAALVSVVIALTTWGLLRASFSQAMDAVPAHIDSTEVQRFLVDLPEVEAVHHLHIWSIGTQEIALTAHVVRSGLEDHDAFLERVAHALEAKFGINHSTLQVELGAGCGHDREHHAPHA